MDRAEKLKEFGLTNNQAKLLSIFIKMPVEQGLTFRKIKEEFKKNKPFYWEDLDDLVTLKFLSVNKEVKPRTYRYNESRLNEIFGEQQKLNLELQQKFEKIIKDLSDNNSSTIMDLKYIFNQLQIEKDQIKILNSLFSKEDGKFESKTRTLQQIANEIKELKPHTIRYNLNNLEKGGFIISQKIGRENSYSPKDLLTIIKTKENFYQKNWEEKEKRMQNVIAYYYKKEIFNNEPILNFKGELDLLKYIKLAKEEILIILPISKYEKNLVDKKIQTILETFLKSIQDSNILFKVLIDSQIENINLEVIIKILKKLPQINIKITSNPLNSFVIVIDESNIVHSFNSTSDFFVINDIQTAKLYKKEFYKIWKKAEDFRLNLIHDNNFPLLKDEIERSKKNYPLSLEILEKYELIDFDSDIISRIKNFMRTANNDMVLDFRITTERVEQKIQMAKEFYSILINVLEEKPSLKVKLCLYLDDWIIQKLDSIYIKLIQMVSQKKLEIRVPLEENRHIIRIIIDNSILIDFMEKQNISEFDKILLNRNDMNIKETRKQMEEVWKFSLDARFLILDIPISNELELEINDSMNKNPPIFEFINRPYIIIGKKSVKNIILNIFKTAIEEILTISSPFSVTQDGNYTKNEILYEKNYYLEIFKTLFKKCQNNVNVKLIRNTLKSNMTLFQNKDIIKYQISTVLDLFPMFQVKKIEAPSLKFSIIDKKILGIIEYLEFDQVKLTIITNNLMINEFYATFQRIWDEALDIRIDFLSNLIDPISKYVESSFDKVDLQVKLPEKREIKVFDGKYVRYIVNLLLKISKQEVCIFQTSSSYLNQQNKEIKEDKILISLVMSYFWDVMKVIAKIKLKTRVIVKFLPYYIRAITYSDLKHTIDNYPSYQAHFSTEHSQSNIIYGIYDDYLTFIMGDFSSGEFQMLVINDVNLRNYYKDQFEKSWNNSIDLRQIIFEYGIDKKKKLILKSYKKFKLEKEFSPDQIKELFPLTKKISQ